MSNSMHSRRPGASAFYFALLGCALSGTAHAQARKAIDSAAVLAREGRWIDVAGVTQPAMAGATAGQRCQLMFRTIDADTHLWRVGRAESMLRTLYDQCGTVRFTLAQGSELAKIQRTIAMPPMPKAGVDWSGVDEFWMAVDTLTAGREPRWSQWRGLVTSPGYRIAMLPYSDLPRLIDIAFNPLRRAERDSVLSHASQDSSTIAHLLTAASERSELARLRQAIEPTIGDTIAAAIKSAERFLPAGATAGRRPPFIAVTIFAADGYSLRPGIVLDLEHIRETGLTDFLAHEFNHSFAARFDRTRPTPGALDGRLFGAIRSLRNEGIADMIDKPYPLREAPSMEWYDGAYNAAYAAYSGQVARAGFTARGSDDGGFGGIGGIGAKAQRLLPYGSHPNGAYMARTILEALGRDSLVSTETSPFAFIRMFRQAEARRGDAPVFSPAGIAALDAMEQRYTIASGTRRHR